MTSRTLLRTMSSASSCCRGLKQSHSIRTNSRPIAIIWRSCSDSPVTASHTDEVFGSDRGRHALAPRRVLPFGFSSDTFGGGDWPDSPNKAWCEGLQRGHVYRARADRSRGDGQALRVGGSTSLWTTPARVGSRACATASSVSHYRNGQAKLSSWPSGSVRWKNRSPHSASRGAVSGL
jgi:hypothetical protein